MMVTGTNLVLTMLYKCRVIFITMVTVTNLVLKLDQNLELLSYFDNDGHWNQFCTTDYYAIEVQSDFHNDGHWDQFGTHT